MADEDAGRVMWVLVSVGCVRSVVGSGVEPNQVRKRYITLVCR